MATTTSPHRTLGALAPHLWVIGGLAALTVAITWPLAAHLSHSTAAVGVGDPLLYARLLHHDLRWVTGQDRQLFDAGYFWPHPLTLATEDDSIAVLYAALPFLPFTRDLLSLLNLGLLLSFVLTGHATWLLTRELTGSAWAGWVAALAVAFSPWRFHQLDHLALLHWEFLIYALAALWRLRATGSWKAAVAAGAMLFLHFSASNNMGLYSVFLVAGVLVWVGVTTSPELRRRVALRGGLSGVIAAGALLPFYLPYLQLARAFPWQRPDEEVRAYSGTLEQLHAVPGWNWLYGQAYAHDLGRESLAFLGWTVLALAATALLLRGGRSPEAGDHRGLPLPSFIGLGALVAATACGLRGAPWGALLLIAGILALACAQAVRAPPSAAASFAWVLSALALFYFLCSLGPNVTWRGEVLGRGLWGWVRTVPGFAQVRTPARLWAYTVQAVGILAGVGCALVLRRWRSGLSRAVWAAAFSACMLAEAWSSPVPLVRERTTTEAPPVYRWLAEQPGPGAVLELPVDERFERQRMYFETLSGRPTVDAVSGIPLPVLDWVGLRAFLRGEAPAQLRRLRDAGLEFALVHEPLLPRAYLIAFQRALLQAGATPLQRQGGIEVWRFEKRMKVVSFSAAHVATRVAVSRLPAEPDTLQIQLTFTVRQPETVFEPGMRRLLVEARGAEERATQAVYFAPPLISAELPEVRTVKLKVPGLSGAPGIPVTVRDESGAVWSASTRSAER